uniref:Uncharacterized protein n=1 Tax=Arundo donax TaxID=35708 RepID=A0A0A8Z2I1_ARUDO
MIKSILVGSLKLTFACQCVSTLNFKHELRSSKLLIHPNITLRLSLYIPASLLTQNY